MSIFKPAPMPSVAALPISPTRMRPINAPMKSIRIALARWSREGTLETIFNGRRALVEQ